MGNRTIVLGVGGIARPDAATVDALARLQLTARRLGYSIVLSDVPAELRELLEFTGLDDVVPVCVRLLGPGRQPEEREQPGGIEEEGHPADPLP
ncbi:MAG TPA: STAS domain-containing protein [Acidimicrobiia bacterium]|nr:STAS domain-containing protein [Acidimicrobiia bacterium]